MNVQWKSLLIVTLTGIIIGCRDNSSGPVLPAYDNISTIRYSEHVQPILNRNCATSGCHDALTQAAGLALTSWSSLIRGSSFGEAVVARQAARSLLTVLFDGTVLRRSHPAMEARITPEEIRFLKRWIDGGARNDAGVEPYAECRNRLYVPNQGDDNVAIVDTDSLVVVRYVSVGNSPAVDGPHFVAANDRFWYVSLIGTGEVWKFEVGVDTLVGIGHTGGQPALMALTPDGSKLYVSQFMNSPIDKITVFSTATMTAETTLAVGRMPHGLRMNTQGTRLYCVNMLSDDITIIDVATDEILGVRPMAWDVTPFSPPKYMPIEVAVSPDGGTVLVTCSETEEVRMFDGLTLALVDSFTVGDQPWHLQFSPNGQLCYVSNRRGNSVSVIHLPMRHVMETITTTNPVYLNYPHGCEVSGDGRYTFVSSENVGHGYTPRYQIQYIGNICVIENLSNQIVKVIEVGRMPTGIAIAR